MGSFDLKSTNATAAISIFTVSMKLSAALLVNFCSWVDDYFMDDMVFVKHNIMAGHYLTPVDFDRGNMTATDVDGVTVYDLNSVRSSRDYGN